MTDSDDLAVAVRASLMYRNGRGTGTTVTQLIEWLPMQPGGRAVTANDIKPILARFKAAGDVEVHGGRWYRT